MKVEAVLPLTTPLAYGIISGLTTSAIRRLHTREKSVMSPNRNDPCPCGSGKKYKQCCMPKHEASRLEKLLWERAYRSLRTDLIEFAREEDFTQPVAEGLKLFWGPQFVPQALELMNEDEALLFFDWFVFDHRWGDDGLRLIDRYAVSDPEWLDDKQREMLQAWVQAPPGGAFQVVGVSDEGRLRLRNLLADRLPAGTPKEYEVDAPQASKAVTEGEILLGRPVPVGGTHRLSGATVRLPGETAERLAAFLAEGQAAYDQEHPNASLLAFLRDRAYLFPHFAMQHAEEQGVPPVSFAEGGETHVEESKSKRPTIPGRKVRRIGRGSN
ncbi:MAG: hypothetical protein GX605_14175 [Chloroflexi bacterium]|nr:hypothetical protein [Chloroflexota bacterium]